MTGPKELALFTAAAMAAVVLSGEASGQLVVGDYDSRLWRPGPPPIYLPPGIGIGGGSWGNPYWRTGGLAGRRRRRDGVPLRRYGYGAAQEEEGEARRRRRRRRRREGVVEEAADTGIQFSVVPSRKGTTQRKGHE